MGCAIAFFLRDIFRKGRDAARPINGLKTQVSSNSVDFSLLDSLLNIGQSSVDVVDADLE